MQKCISKNVDYVDVVFNLIEKIFLAVMQNWIFGIITPVFSVHLCI